MNIGRTSALVWARKQRFGRVDKTIRGRTSASVGHASANKESVVGLALILWARTDVNT